MVIFDHQINFKMSEKEVMESIFSTHKWYVGIMSQPSASMFKKRYFRGEVKKKTTLELIRSFDFEIDKETTFKKVKHG